MKLDEKQTVFQLKLSRTLTEAETRLALLTPIPSRAWRWGCWDGWDDRPSCLSGLIVETPEKSEYSRKTALEYDLGVQVGKCLRKESLCET